MNIRTTILLLAAFLLLGLAASLGCGSTTGISSAQAAVNETGPDSSSDRDGNATLMQDDSEDPGDDDSSGGDDPDEEDPDEEDPDDEEPDEEEPDEEEPAEEEPSSDVLGGLGDILGQPVEDASADENLNNALAGIADYEVTYDTSVSHEENTDPRLRALGVVYAGENSDVARRTQAMLEFNLVDTLSLRYEDVEAEYAADPEADFAPEDPDNTFNYFEPRADPFVIPSLIPEELRPALSGTGLDGAVDPEVLEQIFRGQFTANLRYIPIIIVGVIEAGPSRICMYTIPGFGYTWTIEEGESQCIGYGPMSFSIYCQTVSEDHVVLILYGYYDRGCRYRATSGVVRTFHVSR